MPQRWMRRAQRARDLLPRYSSATELLRFYLRVVQTQEMLHHRLESFQVRHAPNWPDLSATGIAEYSNLTAQFGAFLSLTGKSGPVRLADLAYQLRNAGQPRWNELLSQSWNDPAPLDPESLLAQAFLQPCAELVRAHASPLGSDTTHALCPFCRRKPLCGVLRQRGDGGARSLLCGFCLAEWDFRRLVCPGCGEEDDRKLPLFTAEDFPHIRVECCDSCNTYTKSIDLTRDGHVEPLVDELASTPLDLWAREQGYAKLHNNMFGL